MDAMPFTSIIGPTLLTLGGEALFYSLTRPMVRYIIKLIIKLIQSLKENQSKWHAWDKNKVKMLR